MSKWLKELADNSKFWAQGVGTLPVPIACTYDRLQEMAQQGNVYGCLLQIKDEVVAVNNNETLPTVLDTMKTVVLQQAYESDESIEDILKDAQATAEAEAG